jgi:uncharacterized repeat protein (TIGR02543 family)
MKKGRKILAFLIAAVLTFSFVGLAACKNYEVTKTPQSITAEFTQDNTLIYSSTQLNNLKSNLVVTLTYSDGSTDTVSAENYSLSGSLTVGTSTITVTLVDNTSITTTFNVNVIKTAEETLTDAKTAAIAELNSYADPEDYTINASQLTAAIAIGTAQINGATSTSAVESALDNAKAQIDLILTDEQEAELASSIVSISVKTNPDQMTYTVGQSFDPTGMVIEATFENETTSEFAAYDFSPKGALTIVDTKITIFVAENSNISTTLDITVNEKQKLTTPTNSVFSVSTTGSFALNIDRDANLRTSSVENLDYLKIYVYDEQTATEEIATFKIMFDYLTPAITLTGGTATLTINKQSGDNNRYEYISVTNFYVQRPEAETFLSELLGDSFDWGKNYYFAARFIAISDSINVSSDIGAIGSKEWIAKPLTVTFNSSGGTAVPSQEVAKGYKVVSPEDPSFSGHDFLGWFKSNDGGVTLSETAFDFENTPITANITLYAGWEQVGEIVKEKLPTVITYDAASKSNNFMGNGSGLNPKTFTYNRGASQIAVAEWGTKIDYVLVTVYSSKDSKDETQLLQFKITGRGSNAGLILSSLDDTIIHRASTSTDNGYNGVSTTNAFIVPKYFSLFTNLIRAQDGNEPINVGTKLYFSFQLIAPSDSELWLDGDDSDICVNDDGRTFSIVAQDGTFDLGGTNTASANTAIIVFDTDGGDEKENVFLSVGALGGAGAKLTVSDPIKSGYTFEGWYLDADRTQLIDLSATNITADMKAAGTGTVTLYAGWIANP